MIAAEDTDWQEQRAAFNHRWLVPHYLEALRDCCNALEAEGDASRARGFLGDAFQEWPKRWIAADRLIAEYEAKMTPRACLFPPRGSSQDLLSLLGALLHGWWLVRYEVRRRLRAARQALERAHCSHTRIETQLDGMKEPQAAVVRELKPLFVEHLHACCALSEAISLLEHEVRLS